MIVLYQPDRGLADFYMEVITIKKVLSLLLAGLIVLSLPAVSFADFKDGLSAYAVASASNAVMFASDDVATRAVSIPDPVNTVDWSGAYVTLRRTKSSVSVDSYTIPVSVAGTFKCIIPSGKEFDEMYLVLHPSSLPVQGTYKVRFWYFSDASYEWNDFWTWMSWTSKNQTTLSSVYRPIPFYNSGDTYAEYVLDLKTNVASMTFNFLPRSLFVGSNAVGGRFYISFTQTSDTVDTISPGRAPSSDDIQSDISSSTSQIADSVGNMASDIGDMASDMAQAAAELQYISNSQDLIIQGIDNVILHISDQLYAFWDQLFNLIHLPQMDMLGQILQAIKDVNIDVNVDLDELKSSINSMSQALQNKIQSQITNDNKNHKEHISNDNANHEDLVHGYDNTGMNSDKDKLDSAISEYEDAENALLEDATGHITSFEFEDYFTEITGPLSDISYFLQGIFVGLGAFNIPVSFSLALSIALILIGWYRFKGGG